MIPYEPFVIMPERLYSAADNGMQLPVRMPEPKARIYANLLTLTHVVGDGNAGNLIDISLRSAFHADLAITPSWEIVDYAQRIGTIASYFLNRHTFAVVVTDVLVGEASLGNTLVLGAFLKARLTISAGSHLIGMWGTFCP